MRNDVYDYPLAGQVSQNIVLQKTYRLRGLAFLPAIARALASSAVNQNLYAMFGARWMGFVAVLAFFYGMIFLIEKNRYSNTGVVLLMIFTFGMGVLISPLLQYALAIRNGTQIVGVAAAMTAGVCFTMAAMARRTTMNMNSLGRFLAIGGVVLMIAVVANFILQIPALSLAISGAFVVFSSLVIMWQVRTVIDGGEDSHISAALTIFISIYNIFSSLLRILLAFTSDD